MKKLVKYCGLAALLAGAAFCLPSCDEDGGTGPTPYDGPWKIVPCPELPGLHYLTGIHFVNANLGYCVGGPYILKWDGVSWKKDYELIPTPPNDLASCYDVYFLNEDEGWVAGGEGTASEGKGVILHWDGKVWRRVPQSLPMDYLYCIFFLDKNNGWVGGDGIARWDGSRWSYDADIAVVTDVFFNSPNDGWAVSKYSERIYHYDGTTWTRVHEGTYPSVELYAISFSSPEHGWAGGMGCISGTQSNLMEYRNGDWRYFLELPGGEGIRTNIDDIHFSAADCGWAVGYSTFFWDGTKWREVERPPDGYPNAVFTLSEEDAWAVGDGRYRIMHYEP